MLCNCKTEIIAVAYHHTQLCHVCGKAGQEVYETTANAPNPKFDINQIPVGWYSEGQGIACCSEECHLKFHGKPNERY